MLIFWTLCLARWFVHQTVYLHNMITTLLIVRVVTDGLLLLLFLACPWRSFSPEYIETLLASMDTVYKSLFYTIILLISFVWSGSLNQRDLAQLQVV